MVAAVPRVADVSSKHQDLVHAAALLFLESHIVADDGSACEYMYSAKIAGDAIKSLHELLGVGYVPNQEVVPNQEMASIALTHTYSFSPLVLRSQAQPHQLTSQLNLSTRVSPPFTKSQIT